MTKLGELRRLEREMLGGAWRVETYQDEINIESSLLIRLTLKE